VPTRGGVPARRGANLAAMKKLFIGCGIVVLLIVAALGYVTWQVYPQVREWQSQWEGAFTQLQALEQKYPFDAQAQAAAPLDAPRFAASLDLRADLADNLTHAYDKLETIAGKDEQGEQLGFVDMIREMFRTAAPLMPDFQAQLSKQQMSWPEFAFYTRLLWACLYRVDAGVGPPELESLRGSYDKLNQNYDRLRQEHAGQKLPPLADVIGKFPPQLLNEASALLAQNLQRVELGLAVTAVDHFYMQPITRLEDLQGLQAAQEDITRRNVEKMAADEAAGNAVTQPAGAPEPLGKVPEGELQSGKPGDK